MQGKKDCCVWCHRFVTIPEGYDPKKNFLVCSVECRDKEAGFRVYFSDENIGQRNYEQHGVNPNHLGRKK